MTTTLDSVLEHVYLPALKEEIDPRVTWARFDGNIMRATERGYVATLRLLDVDEGTYVYGNLFIDYRLAALAALDPAPMLRAVKNALKGLARDFRAQLRTAA